MVLCFSLLLGTCVLEKGCYTALTIISQSLETLNDSYTAAGGPLRRETLAYSDGGEEAYGRICVEISSKAVREDVHPGPQSDHMAVGTVSMPAYGNESSDYTGWRDLSCLREVRSSATL